MSKEIARYDANSSRFEPNENEFDEVLNTIPLAPPRTPLNSIPDPSQCHELEPTPRGKPEVVRSLRSVDKRADAFEIHAVPNNRNGTPKGPSSAQTTPARRLSSIGVSGPRSALHTAGKTGNLAPRVSRGIPLVNSEISVEVPHFELVEDPSFWKDHNVQVLIRIRPLSDAEKVSQGYGRCLRQDSGQTLVWLGHPETRFTFDHVACETISQEKLFRVAGLPMVENCMSGYNSCMFAYGQTGSGKTYTMMGEIVQMNGKLNDHSGITPRIFEYLFNRIREEEEKQRSERLKFSCKCSFLEIYNEQITDLLEPSSTNLHLREDLKKGVYVENLTEVSGAANRKIAATHMNSESSRSHSVFTCNIESCWEKDSMKHFRFGRLNLVDLAGSERQKSSGADGDRLKEAANINKSLSTLGLVIMSLVDLAQGKQRHVPYRDSRLTFLLQDSLGGNSKTAIIANVSPSSCSANETLSTLKFAQRAKLIQNNAKVNEDASGDVSTLQQQIQLLKGQLSFLMKHHSSSKHISHLMPSLDQSSSGYLPGRFDLSNEMNVHHDDDQRTCERNSKIEKLKATLLGALRREKLADMEVRRLESEIEQMNRLVNQREEDSQRNKMMLRFREEKIKRFELLEDGLISADKYLINENASLREEVQLLAARIERNPELTQLVLENNRLLRRLRAFQNFYDHGQRERLVAEISELRDQFLEFIEYGGNYWRPKHASREKYQVGGMLDESQLVKSTPHPQPVHEEDFLDKSNQQVENTSILDYDDMKKQLMEAKSLMEEMEMQQVHLIEEIEVLKEENCRLLGMLDRNEHVGKQPGSLSESCESQVCLEYTDLNLASRGSADITLVGLQAKLEKVSKDLEVACLVNGKCIEEHALQMTMKHQHELVCEEVEMETAKTILLLQEEISQIKSEFQEKLSSMAEEIISLKGTLAAKEDEMKVVCAEWERSTLDLTNFLTDGSKSLQDAAWQIESIACSFPNVDLFVGEHVERAAKTYIEKEETILLLKKSLEEAQQTVFQMDEKLLSLKGATIAFAEAQQQVSDASSEEGIQLAKGLSDTNSNITFLENKLTHSEVQINEAERCTSFALPAVNSVSDLPELTCIIDMKDQPFTSVQNFGMTDFNNEIESAKREVLELENAIKTSCHDAERLFSAIKSDGYNSVSFFQDLIQDIVIDIRELQRHFTELKEKHGRIQLHTVGVESSNSHEISGCDRVCQMLHKILYAVVGTNDSLNHINACFYKLLNPYGYLRAAEESINSDGSTDCSTSSSYLSDESEGSILSSGLRASHNLQNFVMNSSQKEVLYFLRKELRSTYGVFAKLISHFDTIFCQKEFQNCLCSNTCFSSSLELSESNDQCVMGNESEVIMPEMVPGLEVNMTEAETGCNLARELKLNDRTCQASRFFDKFEEAYRTIKEADHTLQELTKSNESAKELKCMWKRAGEEFMVERARLAEEIQQLNSDVHGKESKYGILQNQMHQNFTEIASSISSIEDTFKETQKYVDTLCKSVLSDAFVMVKETMSCICDSRLLLEEIFTNIVGNGVPSLVLNRNLVLQPAALQEDFLALSNLGESSQTYDNGMLGKVKAATMKRTGSQEIDLVHANSMDENENAELRRELEHKEALLEGLLFDFSLLQESASSKKDVRDEIDKLIAALSQVENELRIKNNQHDDMIVQHRTLENQLKEAQSALFASHSDLLETRRKMESLSKENVELGELLEDLYLKKSETEEELREQRTAVEALEKEIILLTFSTDNQASGEKIQLLEQVRSLQDKLDIAYALANENEAIAVEARQESEASKIYAEEKEEEVKILEHSVEELEGTINILEKKVHETEEEVERHHMIRESLEVELQALKERLLTVENFTEKLELKNSGSQLTEDQFPRSLSHQNASDQIRILEIEKAELVKEVKQCKEYISEILLHAEAQALQYQQKYKDLESMVHEFRTDPSNLENQVSTSDKTEKVSTRIRGSSSPFRCISSLVQQMNLEKDQELSVAKLRIEELEALVAQRQKEVCILNNRLAAAENMTHDVIRDLLGVKLDMTSYADLIDQHQLQKFIVEAHQQSLEYNAMEEEILNLKRQLNDLIQEREAFILQVKRREAIELATQMTIEQLRERDQLLIAQNEMLKMDKTNLQSKVVELDEMVKDLLGTKNMEVQNRRVLRLDDCDRGKRLVNSKKLDMGMNDKFSHYRGPKGTK